MKRGWRIWPCTAVLAAGLLLPASAAERRLSVPETGRAQSHPQYLVEAECHMETPDFRLTDSLRTERPAKVLLRRGSLVRFVFNAKPGESFRLEEGKKPADAASDWLPASGVIRSVYRVKYRQVPNRKAFERLLDEAEPRGAVVEKRIYSGWNPLGPNPGSLHVFEGVLRIARPGRYTFCTASTDASFLEIDGKPVVAWPGNHDVWGGLRGERAGTVELAAGEHRITYLHANSRWSCYSLAGWRTPGSEKKFSPIPESAYTPTLRAKVGPRLDEYGRKIPDFSWQLEEMLTEEGQKLQLYFVSLSPQVGTEIRSVDWGDGTGEGKTLTHAYFKPGDYVVSVRTADGKRISHRVELSYRYGQSLPKPGREAEILRAALAQEAETGLQEGGYRYLSEALRRAKLAKESREFYETMIHNQDKVEPEVLFRHYEATRLDEQRRSEAFDTAAAELRNLIARLRAPSELNTARLALAELLFYGSGRTDAAAEVFATVERSALPKARARSYELLEVDLAAMREGRAAAEALAAKIASPSDRYDRRQLLRLDGIKLAIRNAIVLGKFADGMRYAEQLEEQRPAVRLAPDYLQLKSRLEAGLGRPRSAARLLELARSLAPEDEELRAEIALELGRFYAGRGETAAAIAAWKEVLDAAPRSRSAVTAARLLKEIRQKEVER